MHLEETYNPVEIEDRWYDFWLERGYFHANEESDKEPFTIVIPPPNVTGSLHMGHALFVTLQDILIRWKRMAGYEALWLPGTDHAGIATQLMVTKEIAKEGLSRHDLGRDKFLERVWEWKAEKGGRITQQMKRMGASCDWERERFTMDEGLNRAVREAFVRFYEDGLIYRAERMVNWDPELQTVLSGLEVEQENEQGSFWHLTYPLADGSGEIVVGTTRPETMLGDTAVAVHPDDERYTDHIGKMVKLPLVGREIPIIADTILPDPEKGTGAVKVTPAHDPNDFECGNRHNLQRIVVIGFDAKMTRNCPEEFVGLDRYDARKLVVKKFDELGLLGDIDKIEYAPGRGDRSGVIVEPLPMTQWFVDTEPLAKLAIDAVEKGNANGQTRIIPAVWKKTYDHFMYNIQPWCISRQLWWGHRIPAWYCEDCGHITVARNTPEECSGCGGQSIEQDDDVLDTWFSSGLWPLSTMGWPDETPTLDKFYPTQVMETGFDILFFWVARMLMMGNYFMRDEDDAPVTPFADVFLHAMVRDQHGQKMSKTKGNVIDPLHLIYGAKPEELDPEMHKQLLAQFPEGVESQGADALRFTLTVLAAQGRDVKLDVSRASGYRAFLNKLWNASKFVMMNLEGFDEHGGDTELSTADRWILHRLHEVIEEVDTSLEEYRFNDYAQTLYHFVWHEYCDWYIEFIKPALYDETEEGANRRRAAQETSLTVLEHILRLLHPITPFITEDIWQAISLEKDLVGSIMVAAWPEVKNIHSNPQASTDIGFLIDLITELRQIRGETNVKPSVQIPELFLVADGDLKRAVEENTIYVQRLAKVEEISFVTAAEADAMQHVATAVCNGVSIRIPLKGLIDVEEEVARLEKEIGRVQDDMKFVNTKLSNPNFVDKAPEAIVQKERDKLDGFETEVEALQKSLQELQSLM